jgi:hypothetical protein
MQNKRHSDCHGVYILTYNDVDLVIHGSWERKGCPTFLVHSKDNRRILGHASKDGLMFRCYIWT